MNPSDNPLVNSVTTFHYEALSNTIITYLHTLSKGDWNIRVVCRQKNGSLPKMLSPCCQGELEISASQNPRVDTTVADNHGIENLRRVLGGAKPKVSVFSC